MKHFMRFGTRPDTMAPNSLALGLPSLRGCKASGFNEFSVTLIQLRSVLATGGLLQGGRTYRRRDLFTSARKQMDQYWEPGS